MTRRLVIPLRTYSAETSLLLPEHTLSEHDWAVLMAVLAAMKPALVEPDVADAHIVGPLELSPDEAIEVALVLRERAAASATGTLVRRGTDLVLLADRLAAHERDTAEAYAQDDGDLDWADLNNGAPRPGWQASADDWHEHIARLREMRAGRG